MKKNRWLFSSEPGRSLLAVLAVAATTASALLIGGGTPDRLIVALVYLVPVGWSAARWGAWPCTCATLAAMLAGEFLFIPPRYTFAGEKLAPWLVLAVLLVGANVLASRMRAGLEGSQDRVYEEYLGFFVHELRAALASLHTQEEVVATLAAYLQQLLQTVLVEVRVQPGHRAALIARSPADGLADRAPDRVLLIQAAPDLVGEIRLWDDSRLPPEDSYLFRSLAAEAARALESMPADQAKVRETEIYLAGVRQQVLVDAGSGQLAMPTVGAHQG